MYEDGDQKGAATLRAAAEAMQNATAPDLPPAQRAERAQTRPQSD
jgi:hypothetical protein